MNSMKIMSEKILIEYSYCALVYFLKIILKCEKNSIFSLISFIKKHSIKT